MKTDGGGWETHDNLPGRYWIISLKDRHTCDNSLLIDENLPNICITVPPIDNLSSKELRSKHG